MPASLYQLFTYYGHQFGFFSSLALKKKITVSSDSELELEIKACPHVTFTQLSIHIGENKI